jgi:hypothetical protein
VASARECKDFITNPCWDALLRAVDEQIRQEDIKLRSVSREGNIAKINVQAGVIEGLSRFRLRLDNLAKELDPKALGE